VPEHGDVADAAVDHEAGPTVRGGEPRDHVPEQGHAQRAAAVDDEHAAETGLRRPLLEEHVVLVAADRGDRAFERADTAELGERKAADQRVGMLVEQVGRRYHWTVSSTWAGCGVVPA